jgi:hypothetical protein
MSELHLMAIILLAGITARLTVFRDDSEHWAWKWLWLPMIMGVPINGYFVWPVIYPIFVEGYAIGAFMVLLFDYLDLWPFSSPRPDPDHRRGARVVSEKDLVRMVKQEKETTSLLISKIPIPVRIESQHFLKVGGTGAGKSLAILQMLNRAFDRGNRAILADGGGIFLARYFNPQRDQLLNPLDQRSMAWSPFAEMQDEWDADALAKSLVPDGEGTAKEWHGYCQTLLSAILTSCWQSDQATNERLLYFTGIASVEELRELVADLPAASLVAEGNEKMLGNIRGILGSHIKSLIYLPPEAGRDAFSIRRWVETGNGALYLPYQENQRETLMHLIAAWLDIASRSILSLKPDNKHRIWLIADEVATLGRVQSLIDFLTKARKGGGCAILGLQSISQLRSTYGRDTAQTLLSCLSSWLILRCNDAETAEYMSKYLGEEELRRITDSGGKSTQGQSSSWSEQIARQPVVLPSELQHLPDRHGYLKLPGIYPVSRVEIPVPSAQDSGQAPFVPASRRVRPASVPPRQSSPLAHPEPVIEIDL